MASTQTVTTTTNEKFENKPCEPYKQEIVWKNVILLGSLHIGAAYGLYLNFTSPHGTPGAFVFGKIISILSGYGITAGAHRLWTHKSYKANVPAQILLMIMASLMYQNSVYIWARDHRMHHKYSETDADPHNSKRGFFFSHVGWLLVKKHPEVIRKGKLLDMSDLEANPIVMFQHRHYFKFIFFVTVLFPILVVHYYFNVPLKECFFVGILYRYIVTVNFTWCINSLTHSHGQKPYNKHIGPTENKFMKIASLGEGFHNYHHEYPWDYKAAEFSWDTRNTTTMFIDFLAYIGWVSDRKTASESLISAKCEKYGKIEDREDHMLQPGIKRVLWSILYLGQLAVFIWIF